jgi:hypothetical protein
MIDEYEVFVEKMHSKYPTMFAGDYGGICVSKGWWPIIDSLCGQIQAHLKHRNGLASQYPDQHNPVEEVVIDQIKEKFGGLRFYYTGGDETIYGMVRMAESWASHSCEECGSPGNHTKDGWIKTLCNFHIAEREALRAEQMRKDGFEE